MAARISTRLTWPFRDMNQTILSISRPAKQRNYMFGARADSGKDQRSRQYRRTQIYSPSLELTSHVPSIRSDHQQRDQTKKGAQAAMTSHASDSSPGVIPREHTKGPAASLPPFKSCPAPTFPPPAASLLFPPLPKVSVQILTSTTGSQQQP